MSERIETYLDQLVIELRGHGRDVRRILGEVEDHLVQATDDGIVAGLTREEAERRAVERFGTPRLVARRFSARSGLLRPGLVLPQLLLALTLLAGIGCAAIGASGVLAAAGAQALGKSFVVEESPGAAYTPARCADFARFHPEAPSCTEAALAHHYDEVVGFRLDLGVLGVLLLAGWALVRRRRRRDVDVLPLGFVPTLGASAFGVAAVGLLGIGGIELASGVPGPGEMLTAGAVALAAFAAFAARLTRVLLAIQR